MNFNRVGYECSKSGTHAEKRKPRKQGVVRRNFLYQNVDGIIYELILVDPHLYNILQICCGCRSKL